MTGNGAPSAFKQADPCSLVVFGASGDLMHSLLVPALYNLAAGGLLPDAFALIGVGRSDMSDDALREGLRKSLQQFATRPVEEKLAQRVVGCATYVRGDVDDQAEMEMAKAKNLEALLKSTQVLSQYPRQVILAKEITTASSLRGRKKRFKNAPDRRQTYPSFAQMVPHPGRHKARGQEIRPPAEWRCRMRLRCRGINLVGVL